jgi:hypothetical protein
MSRFHDQILRKSLAAENSDNSPGATLRVFNNGNNMNDQSQIALQFGFCTDLLGANMQLSLTWTLYNPAGTVMYWMLGFEIWEGQIYFGFWDYNYGFRYAGPVSINRNNWYWVQMIGNRLTGGSNLTITVYDNPKYQGTPVLSQGYSTFYSVGAYTLQWFSYFVKATGYIDISPIVYWFMYNSDVRSGQVLPWDKNNVNADDDGFWDNATVQFYTSMSDIIKMDEKKYQLDQYIASLNSSLDDQTADINDSLASQTSDIGDSLSSQTSDIGDMLPSYEATVPGDPADYLSSDTYVPSESDDHFQTRMISVIDDWISSFIGGLQYGTYDCHLTGLLGTLRNPINYFVNKILSALVKIGAGVIDSFSTFIEPLAGFLDEIIGRISPVIVEMMQDILHFLKTEVDFVPFMPEICTMFSNILEGSDAITEISAMIDAGASTYIDSAIDVINTIIHVLDYVLNYVFEITGTSIETKDLTPTWNRFVRLMAEDNDDYASIGLYATTIGIKTQGEGTFVIPVSLSSGFFEQDYDVVDVILELWASHKFPWIHPVSIPVPLGASYIVIKDIPVPLSGYLSWAQTGDTKFGGLSVGFTVKDIFFDWFLKDLIVWVGHHIGLKGKDALMLAIQQVEKRLQPTVKDIIKRISPEGEAMKYDDENLSLWNLSSQVNDNVLQLQDNISVMQTYSEYMVEFSLYLEKYALWLQNPRSFSRPEAPISPFS